MDLKIGIYLDFGIWNLAVFIPRSPSPLRGDPGDDPVGVHDVTGLAVDTVRGIELEMPPFPILVLHHLVDIGWTEALTGVSILN